MKTRILTLCLGGLLLFSCDSKKGTPKYQEIEGVAGTVEYKLNTSLQTLLTYILLLIQL